MGGRRKERGGLGEREGGSSELSVKAALETSWRGVWPCAEAEGRGERGRENHKWKRWPHGLLKAPPSFLPAPSFLPGLWEPKQTRRIFFSLSTFQPPPQVAGFPLVSGHGLSGNSQRSRRPLFRVGKRFLSQQHKQRAQTQADRPGRFQGAWREAQRVTTRTGLNPNPQAQGRRWPSPKFSSSATGVSEILSPDPFCKTISQSCSNWATFPPDPGDFHKKRGLGPNSRNLPCGNSPVFANGPQKKTIFRDAQDFSQSRTGFCKFRYPEMPGNVA